MKTIAIVSKKSGIGGVERCLQSMLNDIDYRLFTVDLYLSSYCEPNLFKSDVNIYKMKTVFESKRYLLKHPLQGAAAIIFLLLKSHIKFSSQLILSRFLYQKNKKKYDVVISYDGPMGMSTFYALFNLCARKKKIWIHGNIIKDNIPKRIINYYGKYDEMIFVSNSIKIDFLNMYPMYKDKCHVYYNHVDYNRIIELAKEYNPYEIRTSWIICTVARLSYEKGIDIAIECAKILDRKGVDFKWYVIGDGPLHQVYSNLILNSNLNSKFILVGELSNPYPYMKNCDIYVQPSRTEGFCTTSNEVKIFKKPIIVTNVGGMEEQFTNNVNAIITDIKSVSICKAIVKLIDSPLLKRRFENSFKIKNNNRVSLSEILL